MYRPLADELRPTSLDQVVGQKHILDDGCVLRRLIDNGTAANMIFYGPSGCGKTTVANIIAAKTNRTLHKLNATTASINDIKAIIGDVDTFLAPGGILLYLDEIQYFNKKQQQSLLEFIENGKITLIASTTENPYFYVYNAILSRCTVFEFKEVPSDEIEKAVLRAMDKMSEKSGCDIIPEAGAVARIASASCGDVRKAINAVELICGAGKMDGGKIRITLQDAIEVSQRSSMRYDRDGDSHYDILSAFQKSIRGSDPDAAIHYLARLLEAGDMTSACRRLLVTAAEDIGLAYPQALSIVKSCVDSALQLGLPEARIPLADAVILLATAPKSNSGICAIDAALEDIRSDNYGDIPAHLKDSHYSGAKEMGRGLTYQYPHQFENHYIVQQYLPDEIADRHYYQYGENKTEQAAKKYWDNIKPVD